MSLLYWHVIIDLINLLIYIYSYLSKIAYNTVGKSYITLNIDFSIPKVGSYGKGLPILVSVQILFIFLFPYAKYMPQI